ncbi:1-phosphofructokinase [Echinicola marina]|uniref:1-phosphofructokinase family hexose kinase n=1 Tax=Echinicola marina TaxID=2859768 RepID=UPI001CF62BB3|nr:PfkB family carbohydrate kinase [Echinicola marina]UCS93599.1 1-phosphofructokinase [Echinicola marina]
MILSVCPNPSVDTYAWLNTMELGVANRITKLQEFAGGKGVHVAMALNEFGSKTDLLGSWAGHSGKWIREFCEELGMKSYGPELVGANRKCYTFLSEDEDLHHTELLEPGPELNEGQYLAFIKNFSEHLDNAGLAVLSGSWPKGSPAFAYAEMTAIAEEKGKKVILDCSGIQLANALERGFFGLHLNEHEAKELCGKDDPLEAMQVLSEKVDLVALTRGKEGLYLGYLGKIIHANVVIDQVVSTVGSGDCLTAGIAYGVNQGFSVEEIARHGVAFGAANCLREDLGMLYRSDVEELLPKVSIKELSYA